MTMFTPTSGGLKRLIPVSNTTLSCKLSDWPLPYPCLLPLGKNMHLPQVDSKSFTHTCLASMSFLHLATDFTMSAFAGSAWEQLVLSTKPDLPEIFLTFCLTPAAWCSVQMLPCRKMEMTNLGILAVAALNLLLQETQAWKKPQEGKCIILFGKDSWSVRGGYGLGKVTRHSQGDAAATERGHGDRRDWPGGLCWVNYSKLQFVSTALKFTGINFPRRH